MRTQLRHSKLLLAVLCCSTAFVPSLALSATPTPTPSPITFFPPKTETGEDCNTTDLQVLAWKAGERVRCVSSVKLAPTAGSPLEAPGVESTGDITTTGNVGIKTDSPTKPLDVVGDARVTGAMNTGSLSTGSITAASITTTGPATLASASVGGATLKPTTIQMTNNLATLLPSCANGTPLIVSGGAITCATPTPTPPASCVAAPKTWTVGSYTCAGTAAALANGATQNVSSSNGYSGTLSVTCSNGTLIENSSPAKTCTAASCAAQSVPWTANGVSCQGTSASLNNGQTQSISSTNGNTGTQPVVCTNGTLFTNGAGTCATPAPTGCPGSQSITWGTCQGTTTAGSNGQTQNVTSTTTSTGTYPIVCSSGTWMRNGTPTCATPAPAATCVPTVLSWAANGANCTGTSASLASGQTQSLSSTNGNTGTYPIKCNMGILAANGAVTCSTPTPAATCAAKAFTWSASGVGCSGTSTAIASGQNQSVSSTNGNTGTYPVVCSNGTWMNNGTATCATPTPAATCAAKSVSWSANGVNCGGTSTAIASGQSQTINSTNGNTGSYPATCSNGTLSLSGTATCATPAPVNCMGLSFVNWSVNGVTCNAQLPATFNDGQTVTVTANVGNNGSQGNGSAQYRCTQGTYARTGTSTCAGNQPCTGYPISWRNAAGTASCSGTVPNLAHGGSATVSSTNGNTGSVTATCNNTQITAPSTGTCSTPTPAPANCAATGVNWQVNGVSCSGPFPATAANATVRVNANPGFTGWADFTCTNGMPQVTANKSCTTPTPAPTAPCSATNLNWADPNNPSAGACRAYSSGMTHNQTMTFTDGANGNGMAGQSPFTCNNGVYEKGMPRTCYVSPGN